MNDARAERSRAALLGTHIREARRARDLTGSALASRAEVSQGSLSKIEAGKLVPSIDLLCRIGAALEVPADTLEAWLVDAQLVPSGGALPYEFLRSSDVERYQRIIEALEVRASFIRLFQSQVIPGQLQTPEYARATMRLVRTMSPSMLESAVEARLRRRALITGGKQCAFVLTEEALRARVATGRVMTAQIDALEEFAALPNVELGVIPWSTRLTSGRPPTFYIFDSSVVHVELPHCNLSLENRDDIKLYEELFAAQRRMAVTGPACIAVLERIKSDHKKLDEQDQLEIAL
jgi:transcriptional regulator with XRE-family HTH domain